MVERILFVRVGWMLAYNGPCAGDEKPIGGGSFTKAGIGHELYNFHQHNGYLYGYFQPSHITYSVALERIDPSATKATILQKVLVVFVATNPTTKGQFIVGWYKNAKVWRELQKRSPGKPKECGHFCSARANDGCVLVPPRKRKHQVYRQKGGMGIANIWYPFEDGGTERKGPWIQGILKYIADYQGPNGVQQPETLNEDEVASAVEQTIESAAGQGFAHTPKERKAIEDHSMAVATRHFQQMGFQATDVSATRSYDLECSRGKTENHVEVKGTTTTGSSIVLTANEVRHATNPRHACVLFILHSIKLKHSKATGGKIVIRDPWKPKKEFLKIISYTYKIVP